MLWFNIKRYWKIGAAVGGAILGYIVVRRILKSMGGGKIQVDYGGALELAKAKAKDQIAAAHEQYQVEVAAARTEDTAIQAQLKSALAESDGQVRRKQIAAIGKGLGL